MERKTPMEFWAALGVVQSKQRQLYRDGARACLIGDCGYDDDFFFRVTWMDKDGSSHFTDVFYIPR